MSSSMLALNMVVPDALRAMLFYERVFGAERGDVFIFPDRQGINEANVVVGGVCLRLIDANDDYDCYPPEATKMDSVWLQLEVEDAEATLSLAVDHGAQVRQRPAKFMGKIHAEIADPFGYTWTIKQVLEEISFEERYKLYDEIHQSEE